MKPHKLKMLWDGRTITVLLEPRPALQYACAVQALPGLAGTRELPVFVGIARRLTRAERRALGGHWRGETPSGVPVIHEVTRTRAESITNLLDAARDAGLLRGLW